MSTPAGRDAIAELLTRTKLCHGIGNGFAPDGTVDACSIAAINLALTGRLTDTIPDCMSRVIGRWIIRIQDEMPLDQLNSPEWVSLLSAAAGTGREHEGKRRDLILAWMWDRLGDEAVLSVVPEPARAAWDVMLDKRTYAAAATATAAAAAAATACAYDAADATDAVAVATDAVACATDAAAAYAAATATACAATACADAAYWLRADPAGLLRKLIEVSA